MTKKKETKRERSERIRREAENMPSVRLLRKLVDAGMKDLARREAAGEKVWPSGLHSD